jgi:hypothetical protein
MKRTRTTKAIADTSDVTRYIGGRVEVAPEPGAPRVIVGQQAELLRSVEGWYGQPVRFS